MTVRHLGIMLGAALGLLGAVSVSSAGERGCHFLLCIQYSGWPGVAECPPTVVPILEAMDKGIPPPPCEEAGWNGGIGYQRYEECPQGWTPFSQASDRPGQAQANMCRIRTNQIQGSLRSGLTGGRNRNPGLETAIIQIGDKSVQARLVQEIGNGGRHGNGNGSENYYEISRPLRAQPYYVDMNDANGGRQRVWFSRY